MRPCLTVLRLCRRTDKYELSDRCMCCIINHQKCEWPAGAISKNAGMFLLFQWSHSLLTLICVCRTPYTRLYRTLLKHRGPVSSSKAARSNVGPVQCIRCSGSYQFAAQEHGEGNVFHSAGTRPFLGYCDKADKTYFPHSPPVAHAECLFTFRLAYFNRDNGIAVTARHSTRSTSTPSACSQGAPSRTYISYDTKLFYEGAFHLHE
ncbi:hypothetical protein EV702DRAFT_733196 [Suillus placidus]|uniref:Uncharacterized protein n=1 Tax=Suillus placidus TaxID=48579 RepID=A0A9P7D5Z3_9AGAM|nr:hypothetical protein EV702DRAFT_733196 [Suillus placidus]